MMRTIIADDKFSPLARYNAVLVLGELNASEAASGKRAVALPEAVPALIELLDAKRAVDDANDALRVAALVSLIGHAERGGIADKKMRNDVTKRLQDLAAEEKPSSRGEDVHKWIQRRAQTVLDALGGTNAVAGRPAN